MCEKVFLIDSTIMNSLTLLQSNFKKIFPYLKRYRLWAFLTILFVLTKEGSILFEPVIFREVIVVFEDFFYGTLEQSDAITKAIWLLVAFVIVQSGQILSNMLMLRWTNRLQSSVMRDGANDFVAKVLNLSFRFHSERKTGKLAKEFARGVNAMEAFMDAFIFNLIPLAIRLSVIFVVYFFIDWPLAIILLGMSATFSLFTAYASAYNQRKRAKANRLDDEGSRKAMDALMNAEAVKYFQQEKDEINTFKEVRQNWKVSKQREWDDWMWISTGQITITMVSVTLMLAVMILRLLNGGLGLADFVLVISYLTFVIAILWDFQHHIRRLQEAFTDLSAFFYYYDQDNEIQDTSSALPIVVKQGHIRFDNVTFAYEENERAVLKNASFEIPAGKSVAFVGPSGVGKSTIIKLLYRFYDVQSGQILIDGQDISTVTQKSLRESLGIVPQETALFNETVAYNIAYGSNGVSKDEIERVAALAHVDDFIGRLPDGYDTLVGERGVKLSGGEKQRISIARAFLRDSKILVLDEATSSLDSAAEAGIQSALRELMKNRTTLIIAHRLSTIMSADLIIVLNNGTIEQQGTHEELLKKGGLYNRLWELQAGGYIE